ncbi:MAG: hypothetical protein M3065_19060 [Actinomycetota bacterium]|nr:hypothetical protein [Actinomycetota bacterium]
MAATWVLRWLETEKAELRDDQLSFLADIDTYLPGSIVWRDERGRKFERLALEGPARAPRVVAYLNSPRRPGFPLAFEWPLAIAEGMDDWAVFIANLMEHLDEAGFTLPSTPGKDGVARF